MGAVDPDRSVAFKGRERGPRALDRQAQACRRVAANRAVRTPRPEHGPRAHRAPSRAHRGGGHPGSVKGPENRAATFSADRSANFDPDRTHTALPRRRNDGGKPLGDPVQRRHHQPGRASSQVWIGIQSQHRLRSVRPKRVGATDGVGEPAQFPTGSGVGATPNAPSRHSRTGRCSAERRSDAHRGPAAPCRAKWISSTLSKRSAAWRANRQERPGEKPAPITSARSTFRAWESRASSDSATPARSVSVTTWRPALRCFRASAAWSC